MNATIKYGISMKQFEKLMRLGSKMDGRRVRVASGNGPQYHWWIIQLPIYDGDGVTLVPGGRGNEASSLTDTHSYGYTHGHESWQAAVDVAKDLASALGFPCEARCSMCRIILTFRGNRGRSVGSRSQ